ncbi:MAG: TylF/MycF/NovP-related O-methyltransferase [Candidatus Omnitrophota bacterium]
MNKTPLVTINKSPLFDKPEGWGSGFTLAKGKGPGVVVGPGSNNPNVFAQRFSAKPMEQFKIVARASSVGKPKARGRFQINWESSGKFLSASIKAFEVTAEEKIFEHYVIAPPGTVSGTIYVVPDKPKDVVRYTEMTLLSHSGSSAEIAPEPPQIPRFPSKLIHLSDPVTRSQYGNLFRGYDDEVTFKEMILAVQGYTMVTYDGLCGLLSMVRYCERAGIPGDYVEVGVWKGGCAGLMAQGSKYFGKSPRKIHVFDSFQGLPQPIASKDFDGYLEPTFAVTEATAQGVLQPIGMLVASENDVRKLLFDKLRYPKNQVSIHKGWFQESIPAANSSIESIAILRLDGDLYDSYRIALEYLYPKVVKNGFVIIDDWVFGGCRKAVMEYFEKNDFSPYLWTLDGTTRCFQKL